MEIPGGERIILSGKDLAYYTFVEAVLTSNPELATGEGSNTFGMNISEHPFFKAEIEHFPFTDEERDYLIAECGTYLPKSVGALNMMRKMLDDRRTDDSKRRRGEKEA